MKYKDVGSYRDLERNAEIGDDLEHDHIPSSAAVIKFVGDKLNSKFNKQRGEGRNIHYNATVIEVPKSLHSHGRTYKSRNNNFLIIRGYPCIADFAAMIIRLIVSRVNKSK